MRPLLASKASLRPARGDASEALLTSESLSILGIKSDFGKGLGRYCRGARRTEGESWAQSIGEGKQKREEGKLNLDRDLCGGLITLGEGKNRRGIMWYKVLSRSETEQM